MAHVLSPPSPDCTALRFSGRFADITVCAGWTD